MSRKLKNWFLRLIPAYRVRNAFHAENEAIQQQLKTRVDQMNHKMEYLFWVTQRKQDETLAETKQRVFLSLPKAEGELRLIQKMNLSILSALREVCDASEIPFYLVFGTMLGAIRHHGFIPWDDDVDVAMLRDGYLKLEKALQNHPTLCVDRYYSTMNEKFVKVKFHDSDTFFLDLFILDTFEADEETFLLRYQNLKTVHKEYSSAIREYLQGQNVDRSAYSIPKSNKLLDSKMRERYEQLCEAVNYYGKGDYFCFGIDNPAFIRNSGYVYHRDELFPAVSVTFEGQNYQTFACWDAWLRNAYGDYWSFPRNIMTGHGELSRLNEQDYQLLEMHGILDGDNQKNAGKGQINSDSLEF